MFKIIPMFKVVRFGKNWSGAVGIFNTEEEAKKMINKLTPKESREKLWKGRHHPRNLK